MARKKHTGSRTKSGRLSRSKVSLAERNPPADYILERRELFSFVTPTKGPDGRAGEIDQDICDALGQLHAVGLFEGHGYDPQDMRDRGREYQSLYWREYIDTADRVGKLEPSSRSTDRHTGLNERDSDRFNLMRAAMPRGDYSWFLSVIEERGDIIVPWAQSLIDHELISRKRLPRRVIVFPTGEDYARLHALIRCLCAIVEVTVAPRWKNAA